MIPKRLFVIAVTALIPLASISSYAQSPADLQERLEAARAEIARVQEQAETVEEQIASIDEQVAAVENALAISSQIVEETQIDISLLERRVAEKERLYRKAQEQVADIAVGLYIGGANQEIEALLSAESLSDLATRLEYMGESAEGQDRVMVSAARIKAELELDRIDLEAKLAEAQAARREQLAQAQHLKELRAAESKKLAVLRDEIAAEREEADAIQARSQEIAAQLAAASEPAPVAAVPDAPTIASLPSGASGFAWPISGAITSGFGERWGRTHTGIDIDCVTGAPIRASKAGTVVTATYDASGYGNHLVIDHGGGFATLYAHNTTLYADVGQSVEQGETISACGSTGASTGDHLHFEIRVNGSPQDPMAYL